MRPISVVIPAYNCRDYIADAIDSCLSQTVPVHEVIVINDASTDDTLEVARRAAAGDARVKVLDPGKGYISLTRNRGIAAATGDFIAFLDADDKLMPTAIESYQRVLAADPDVDVVFGDYLQSDEPGSEVSGHRSFGGMEAQLAGYGEVRAGYMQLSDRFGPDYQAWKIPNAIVHTNAILIRRALFDRIGAFNTEMKTAEDMDMWGRAFANGRSAVLLGAPPLSIYYRWRGDIGKYVESHQKKIAELRSEIARLSAWSAEWRTQRKRLAKTYLDLLYFIGVSRGDRGVLLSLLAHSLAAWPVPATQLRYLAMLTIPRGLLRVLIRRRDIKVATAI